MLKVTSDYTKHDPFFNNSIFFKIIINRIVTHSQIKLINIGYIMQTKILNYTNQL